VIVIVIVLIHCVKMHIMNAIMVRSNEGTESVQYLLIIRMFLSLRCNVEKEKESWK